MCIFSILQVLVPWRETTHAKNFPSTNRKREIISDVEDLIRIFQPEHLLHCRSSLSVMRYGLLTLDLPQQ